jgi:hypothetical protein
MWRYLFTSKHFRYGLILTCIGAIGLAVFGTFRIYAFSHYGLITLPYTTPIDDISAILFFGSLPVAELIALRGWLQEERRQKQEQEVLSEAVLMQETELAPIAVPAVTNLVFVDHEATLMLGDAVAHLPPMKNEHCLCRAMFKYRINEPVDWSLPYEEMTGDQRIENHEKAKRMVYDTTKSLNSRAKEHLGIDELFSWQGKTIKRTK